MPRWIAGLGLLGACNDNVCGIEREAIVFAGTDAINCGVVGFGDEAGPAKVCVADAFTSNVGFIVQKELTEDGTRMIAMASDGTGVWQLTQVRAVGTASAISAWKCGEASVSPIESEPLLVCPSPEGGENRVQVCPT